MSNRFPLVAAILLVIAMLVSSFFYRVMETETAVKLQFGELVESNIQPGLRFKWPLINQIKKVDARLLTLDAAPASFYTLEKKRLVVDSYVKWRVKDVGAYYKATGAEEIAAVNLLSKRINNNLRNAIGERTLHEVVSGERDQMMTDLTESLDQAASELGIAVIDVRVKKVDFPQENRSAVFNRMRAAREKEARQYRAEGTELSEKIRADAEREKVVIEAEAYREAEETRGAGDAKAAAIYASAYDQDAEFYAFVRRLNAYETSFASKGDVLLVNPDSDFFRFLNDIDGG